MQKDVPRVSRPVHELVSILDQGFEHAETVAGKMYFGHLRHRELLLAGKMIAAKTFRSQVILELDAANLPLQPTQQHTDGICCAV